MIVFAAVGGALLGIPPALAAEALDAGYRSAEQVEEDTGLPVLAHVPKMRPSQLRRERLFSYVLGRPHSTYAEAIRSLYRNLRIASSDHLPKSVLFVSSQPGEGKTTIALSMARMLAKFGRKVLVIDADTRRAEVAKARGWQSSSLEVRRSWTSSSRMRSPVATSSSAVRMKQRAPTF